MKDLKITKREWKVKQNGIQHNYVKAGDIKIQQIGYMFASEGDANALLIADAGTTANKCGLLPSELLAQRNELLEALINIKAIGGFKADCELGIILNNAIKKATE